MRKFVICATDCQDLEFEGELLSSSRPSRPLEYTWTELELYMTNSNKLIVVVRSRSGRRSKDHVAWVTAEGWEDLGKILDEGRKGRVRLGWSWLTRRLIEIASEKCPDASKILRVVL